MQTINFGRSGLKVSQVGFGGGAVSGEGGGYGFGMIDEKTSVELLRQAYDHGINLFDTAPIYGFGTSERRIGKALSHVRDKVIYVSKCGVHWDENKRVQMTNDPAVARLQLETSLRELATDYIDLYMIHWPDPSVDIREPMKVLAEAKEKGTIRHIGLCNTTPEDFELASQVAQVDVLQSKYNLFHTEVAASLFPLVKTHNLGFMAYGTFDQGILTGRVVPGRTYDKADARSHAPWWKKADRTKKFAAMESITKLLEEHGVTHQAMALRAVLDAGPTTMALCGVKSKEQLQSLLSGLEEPPSDSLMAELRAIAKTAC